MHNAHDKMWDIKYNTRKSRIIVNRIKKKKFSVWMSHYKIKRIPDLRAVMYNMFLKFLSKAKLIKYKYIVIRESIG